MSSMDNKVSFTLLKDFGKRADPAAQLDDLRRQIEAIIDSGEVDLAPNGRSTVVATVPAGNRLQSDRLKALLNEKVDGWRVIDDQSYGLPKTF